MQGLTNGTYYNRESVMERIDAARRATDRAERRRLYEEAMTTVLRDRPMIPAFKLHESFGVQESVRHFEPPPFAGENPDLAGEDGIPPGSSRLRSSPTRR